MNLLVAASLLLQDEHRRTIADYLTKITIGLLAISLFLRTAYLWTTFPDRKLPPSAAFGSAAMGLGFAPACSFVLYCAFEQIPLHDAQPWVLIGINASLLAGYSMLIGKSTYDLKEECEQVRSHYETPIPLTGSITGLSLSLMGLLKSAGITALSNTETLYARCTLGIITGLLYLAQTVQSGIILHKGVQLPPVPASTSPQPAGRLASQADAGDVEIELVSVNITP